MSELTQKPIGALTRWVSDGPWRSKSVITAFLVTVVGLLSWVSNIKSGSPQDEASPMTTNAPAIAPTDTNAEPTVSEWNWSKPLPKYAAFSGSFVIGSCIGWFFRRVTRLILVVCGLAIAVLGFGMFAGLDTQKTKDQIRHGTEWAQDGLASATEHVKHLLPSATGGGLGTFMGFWRRRKTSADHSDA